MLWTCQLGNLKIIMIFYAHPVGIQFTALFFSLSLSTVILIVTAFIFLPEGSAKKDNVHNSQAN